MSFFKRLFSSTLRRAHAAEARGKLEQAAALYAEADEPDEVARVHTVRAWQARDPWERIEILRLAHSFADASRDPETHHDVSLALARALSDWVEGASVLDRRDRVLMEEAAELFEAAGEHEEAGDAYARIGYRNKAAAAYTEAGCIDKLEGVYAEQESEQGVERRSGRLIDEFRTAESHGLFLDAHQAIERAIRVEPSNARLREVHARFARRMPERGQVRLSVDDTGTTVSLLSESPLSLGRDENADIALLAPGVSRLHAHLRRDGDRIVIEDVGSKHGTFVDEQEATPVLELGERGQVSLGDHCTLSYATSPQCVVLRPQIASARRTWFIWGSAWRAEPEAGLGELGFRLTDGYWHVEAHGELRIDGTRYTHSVLLRHEARLELPGLPPIDVSR